MGALISHTVCGVREIPEKHCRKGNTTALHCTAKCQTPGKIQIEMNGWAERMAHQRDETMFKQNLIDAQKCYFHHQPGKIGPIDAMTFWDIERTVSFLIIKQSDNGQKLGMAWQMNVEDLIA